MSKVRKGEEEKTFLSYRELWRRRIGISCCVWSLFQLQSHPTSFFNGKQEHKMPASTSSSFLLLLFNKDIIFFFSWNLILIIYLSIIGWDLKSHAHATLLYFLYRSFIKLFVRSKRIELVGWLSLGTLSRDRWRCTRVAGNILKNARDGNRINFYFIMKFSFLKL